MTGTGRAFPELAERPKQLARSLSGGQQQMLALARVLMQEPEILLIDELSLGLAPVVVQRMLELVDRLRARGQTMQVVAGSWSRTGLGWARGCLGLVWAALRFARNDD